MNTICYYQGQTPINNELCNHCSLFLSTCIPTVDEAGYALSSENDCYLCEGCIENQCINKLLINF